MDKRLPTTSMILPAVGLKQHQDFIVLLVTVKLLDLPNLTKNTCTASNVSYPKEYPHSFAALASSCDLMSSR